MPLLTEAENIERQLILLRERRGQYTKGVPRSRPSGGAVLSAIVAIKS